MSRAGLPNLGNTSYISSVVQCLVAAEPLREFFLQQRFLGDLNKTNPLGFGGELAANFAALLECLCHPGAETDHALRVFVRHLKCCLPQFGGYTGQDAAEFLAVLLDSLHEDLNRVLHKPYTTLPEREARSDLELADEFWKRHLLRNQSAVVDTFQGQLRSEEICLSCGHRRVTFEPFTVLRTPLATEDGCAPLVGCIEALSVWEVLEGGEAIFCPECSEREGEYCFMSTKRRKALWSLPKLLLVQVDKLVVKEDSVQWDNTPVDIPVVIDMSRCMSRPDPWISCCIPSSGAWARVRLQCLVGMSDSACPFSCLSAHLMHLILHAAQEVL